jgi:hypothetical protein
MKNAQTHSRYVDWLNADQMHKNSKEWLSELRFIKDEHLFFEDLIKSYTLDLLEPPKFVHNKEIIDKISKSKKRNKLLIKAIKVHANKLQIMLDEIEQPKEEEAYKKEHLNLIIDISEFEKKYRILKMELFDIIKTIKKHQKQILLI